jgi:hypothetical protein
MNFKLLKISGIIFAIILNVLSNFAYLFINPYTTNKEILFLNIIFGIEIFLIIAIIVFAVLEVVGSS